VKPSQCRPVVGYMHDTNRVSERRACRVARVPVRHKPRRKRRAALHRRERCRPTAPNEVCSLDFVADQLADGRRFRALTIMDVFTRESLAIEAGQRLKRRGRGFRFERDSAEARSSEVFVL
jgi:putative transposase